MKLLDWLLVLLLAAGTFFAVRRMLLDRKKGRCCGCCAGCRAYADCMKKAKGH